MLSSFSDKMQLLSSVVKHHMTIIHDPRTHVNSPFIFRRGQAAGGGLMWVLSWMARGPGQRHKKAPHVRGLIVLRLGLVLRPRPLEPHQRRRGYVVRPRKHVAPMMCQNLRGRYERAACLTTCAYLLCHVITSLPSFVFM